MKLFQLFESKELTTELILFQRYISDHDLATELEIEDDKIVFFAGDKLIEWDAAEAKRIRMEVITDATNAYYYARDVIKGQWDLAEPAISKNEYFSYMYAKNLIKGQWELGEPAISKDPVYSYQYAKDVIKGRFKLGEPAISENAEYSYMYGKYAIKGRFKLGEPAISKDAICSRQYQEFLKNQLQ